jgi:hypothetical protein
MSWQNTQHDPERKNGGISDLKENGWLHGLTPQFHVHRYASGNQDNPAHAADLYFLVSPHKNIHAIIKGHGCIPNIPTRKDRMLALWQMLKGMGHGPSRYLLLTINPGQSCAIQEIFPALRTMRRRQGPGEGGAASHLRQRPGAGAIEDAENASPTAAPGSFGCFHALRFILQGSTIKDRITARTMFLATRGSRDPTVGMDSVHHQQRRSSQEAS